MNESDSISEERAQEFAILARAAYGKSQYDRAQMVSDYFQSPRWFINAAYSTRDVAVFVNYLTKEVVVSVRGTDFKNKGRWDDLGDDVLLGTGFQRNTDRYRQAISVIKQIRGDPNLEGFNPIITGHSLGGITAEDVGNDLKVDSITFNPGATPLTVLAEKETPLDLSETHINVHTKTDPISISGYLDPSHQIVSQEAKYEWRPHSIDNFIPDSAMGLSWMEREWRLARMTNVSAIERAMFDPFLVPGKREIM